MYFSSPWGTTVFQPLDITVPSSSSPASYCRKFGVYVNRIPELSFLPVQEEQDVPLYFSNPYPAVLELFEITQPDLNPLTLSQTTNFRLFQIERDGRRQFSILRK